MLGGPYKDRIHLTYSVVDLGLTLDLAAFRTSLLRKLTKIWNISYRGKCSGLLNRNKQLFDKLYG